MTTMRWRAPTLEDAPAALALITARDIADFGAPDYTLEDLREEWQGAELDLAADTVVVEDAEDSGRLVGYAIVRRAESLVVVAPDREGRGLGRGLLAWAERREAERGRDRHRQRIAAGNDRARELLQAAGYRPQPATGDCCAGSTGPCTRFPRRTAPCCESSTWTRTSPRFTNWTH